MKKVGKFKKIRLIKDKTWINIKYDYMMYTFSYNRICCYLDKDFHRRTVAIKNMFLSSDGS